MINIMTKLSNNLYSADKNKEINKKMSFEIIRIEDPDKCFNRNCLGNRCNINDDKKDFCYTHYTKYLKDLEEDNQNDQNDDI
uniref:Uncharacterized protein n=1 Tax=viral metagenome TaxID=1070528 RepID=A0A6C0AC47_9ZZZZ